MQVTHKYYRKEKKKERHQQYTQTIKKVVASSQSPIINVYEHELFKELSIN